MSLSSSSSINPILLLMLAGLALAGAVYLYQAIWGLRVGRSATIVVGFRVVAVVVMVLFLLRPVLSWDAKNPQDARIPVLIDVSRSMSLADAVGGSRRLDAAVRLLTDRSGGILPALAPVAEVRPYLFGADATPCTVESLLQDPPAPGADLTDIRRALETCVKAEGSERIEAVILVSDGQENGTGTAEEVARSLGVPVHCIGVGGKIESGRDYRDLAVTKVDADKQVFIHNKVLVKADISCLGWDDLPRKVTLRRAGETLAETDVTLKAGANDAQLSFTPREAGTFEFEVRVEPMEGERLTENNSRWFVLTVSEDKVKLLYYEATLRWEYKFARQVLSKDPTIVCAGLIKTNPDRVYQQGAGGDLGKGLPTSREGFKKIDCVILGDVGREDFLPGQLALLKQYVGEDGGGLLVVGGRRVLGADGLRGTPLGEALPVTLDDGGRELRGAFSPEVTPDGRAHPALSGLEAFFGANAALRLETVFSVGGVRPGAQALLLVPSAAAGGAPVALLSAQRFGAGRVALYATDSDWKWAMQARERGGEEALALLWGQLARWLANRQETAKKATTTLVLSTDRDRYRPGDSVRVQARGAAAEEGLHKKLSVTATVVDPDAKARPLAFEPAPGGYEAVFRPDRGGEFLVKAALGGAEATRRIVVERSYKEMDRLSLNEDLLRRIAGYSGGRYFTVLNAREIPALLTKNSRVGLARVEHGIDNSPVFFLLFLGFLTAEWILRKQLQLV